MNIKERFEQYNLLNKEIEQLKAGIDREEFQLRKLDISLMLTQPVTGKQVKRTEKKLLEMGEEYVRKMERLCSERLQLEKMINSLEDSRDRIIMRYRYIDLLQWHVICRKVGYERSQVYRIHKNALEKLEHINDKIKEYV